MTLPRGSLEILQKIAENGPQCFSDFTELSIDGKELSSATISKRLDELQAIDAIEETVTRSPSGQKAVGYELTGRGERIITIAEQYEEAMADEPASDETDAS